MLVSLPSLYSRNHGVVPGGSRPMHLKAAIELFAALVLGGRYGRPLAIFHALEVLGDM